MTGDRDVFVRARRPAEKAARRGAILEAAAHLLDQQPLTDVSLNAIARESGLSKPNLYRYFESREEILLALFTDDLGSFAEEIDAGLARLQPTDASIERDVVAVLVRGYTARPRLCRFLGVIASVLELNVSATVIEATKSAALGHARTVAIALHRVLPHLALERCLWLNNVTALLVAGLWPTAHPAPAVNEVLRKPDLAPLRPVFDRDLSQALSVFLAGLRQP